MKRLSTTLAASALALGVWAQPRMGVDTRSLKLGEIVWQNPKTVSYNLKNAGSDPLVITEVRASCGCVSVSYPKTPIPAGQQGTLTAVYDAGMLGTFYRELAVYTNAQQEPLYLSFEGRVVETAVDYEGDFPIDMGNVRLSANYVEFDDVQKGDRPVVELQVANAGTAVYQPQLMHLPQYLSAEYVPAQIQPGRTGKIRLTLDSERLPSQGLNQTSVYVARRIPDRVSDENEIQVSSVLLPAFQNLTADKLARAPHIVFMDGEEMLKGEVDVVMGTKKKVTKTLTVTNIGELPLSITTVQVFNQSMTVSLSDRRVPPHGSAKLKITLDAHQLAKAKSGPRILFISNDPRQPKTILNLNVE